jgi:hypothetical protein
MEKPHLTIYWKEYMRMQSHMKWKDFVWIVNVRVHLCQLPVLIPSLPQRIHSKPYALTRMTDLRVLQLRHNLNFEKRSC